MRIRSAVLIGSSALLLVTAPVTQAQWQEQVTNQLDAANELMSEAGFSRVGSYRTGAIDGGSSERVSFTLQAGVSYQFLGVCDNDCSDLDLTLYDPRGTSIATDVELDDTPLLSITAGQSGTYSLEVKMIDCDVSPCFYGVGLWSSGGGGGGGGAGGGQTQTFSGRLEKGDDTLDDGEYYDAYTIELQRGQRLIADMRSNDFDTYVSVLSPAGEATSNDDYEGSTSRSRVELEATESGTWIVVATSFDGGETGAYTVAVTISGGSAGKPGEAGQEGQETRTGRLESGDETLTAGEYYDSYTVQGAAGQHLIVDLQSSDFDTYVGVLSPTGEGTNNDDYEGSTSRSRVELDLTESGVWTIVATSFQQGETGAYTLTWSLSGAVGGGDSGGDRFESGTLASGDRTLDSGEYYDTFTYSGQQGETVTFDLRSSAFDPYLIVRSPSDEQYDNDDFEGDVHRSLLSLTLEESGSWTVGVTSYEAGETGAYDLRITRAGAGGGGGIGDRSERGTLAAGDQTLETGEYADIISFEGAPGRHVQVSLTSNDFDTYLIVAGPGEDRGENDDYNGSTNQSLVDLDMSETGTYRAVVTTYSAGETGDYELSISYGGGGDDESNDVSRIQMGGNVSGALSSGDETLDTGEYRDLIAFDGQAGQSVAVEMASSDFDTYLMLMTPGEDILQNDDYEGSTSRSRIDLNLPSSGRYYIVATSYGAGESGSYQVSLSSSNAPAPGPAPSPSGGSNVYGIFMGISDYEGSGSDLPYCAEDASNLARAMTTGVGMSSSNAILLTDSQATTGNFRNAVSTMAGRVDSDDILVIFYSGHGSRVDRSGGYEQADPDGKDETLYLYDGHLFDNEMSEMLDAVDAGTILLVLDSCFSGGFAKDVISRPGRMGLFSSEEDVTSMVAGKFTAGGYLAYFIAEAVEQKLADEDQDGAITALELSQYIYERYRTDVKSGGPDDYVSLSARQLGYQHLVVDRGSIAPFQVLFR